MNDKAPHFLHFNSEVAKRRRRFLDVCIGINYVKQILSTDDRPDNGDQIRVTCSENFKPDLAHFPDAQPNPCLLLPFWQCCRKLSGTWENREDKTIVGKLLRPQSSHL